MRYLLQTDDGNFWRLENPLHYDPDPTDRFINLTFDEYWEYNKALMTLGRWQERFRKEAESR